MSYKKQYGEMGEREVGRKYEMTFGRPEAEIEEAMKNATIAEITDALAKQFGIINGTVTLHTISFSYDKETVTGDE